MLNFISNIFSPVVKYLIEGVYSRCENKFHEASQECHYTDHENFMDFICKLIHVFVIYRIRNGAFKMFVFAQQRLVDIESVSEL